MRKLPQAAPWEVQIGYLEKFLHQKGCQALDRLPRDVVYSPALDVFKRCANVALGTHFTADLQCWVNN